MRLTALPFLLIFFCTSPNLVFADTAWSPGPIELDNQHPLAMFHSSLVPESTDVGLDGSSELRAGLTWSSTFTPKRRSYMVDAENRALKLSFRHTAKKDLQLRLDFPMFWQGAGVLDPVIDWWHTLFGLPRGKRHLYEEDEYHLYGINEDNSSFSLQPTNFSLGDIALGAKYMLFRETTALPAWSLAGQMRLPTATHEQGQRSIDLQLSLLGSKHWKSIALYWGGSYIFFGDTSITSGNYVRGLEYKKHHFGGFTNTVYRFSEKLLLHLGVNLSSNLIESVRHFPNYSLYLDTGISYKLSDALRIEFLVRENPAPRYGTVDISGHFALVYRLLPKSPFSSFE